MAKRKSRQIHGDSYFPAEFTLDNGPVTSVQTSDLDPKVRMDSSGFFLTDDTGKKGVVLDSNGLAFDVGANANLKRISWVRKSNGAIFADVVGDFTGSLTARGLAEQGTDLDQKFSLSLSGNSKPDPNNFNQLIFPFLELQMQQDRGSLDNNARVKLRNRNYSSNGPIVEALLKDFGTGASDMGARYETASVNNGNAMTVKLPPGGKGVRVCGWTRSRRAGIANTGMRIRANGSAANSYFNQYHLVTGGNAANAGQANNETSGYIGQTPAANAAARCRQTFDFIIYDHTSTTRSKYAFGRSHREDAINPMEFMNFHCYLGVVDGVALTSLTFIDDVLGNIDGEVSVYVL